ncbi:LemA family protein [soil metagenome]
MNFKKYLPWIIIAVVILWLAGLYNGLVGSRENVNSKWANVEAQYQRRSDLIPNLVSTVKGAADFEKSTLEAVIQARASATQIKINADDLTPEKLQQFQQAQGQVTSALGRLLAVAENYPQLKAVGNFSELQAQLEGTENRINEARRQFNEAAQGYNTSRQKFPRVLIASLFGFKDKPYFQSDAGSEKAPEVKF